MLVIVGVLTGVVALSIGGSGSRTLENAAERSRSLIALACERALIGGRDIGFAPTTRGLQFGYFELEGWRAIDAGGNDELRLRPWGDGVAVVAHRDGERVRIEEEAATPPPFACLSSGELTPMQLTFSRDDVAQRWQLDGALDGSLNLVAEAAPR